MDVGRPHRQLLAALAGAACVCAIAPARAAPDAAYFTDVTVGSGIDHAYWALPPVWGGGGIAIVDLTEDGVDDLLIAGGAETSIKAYRNFGGMYFEESTEIGLATEGIERAIAVADYDDDGDRDVLVTFHDRGPQLFRWDFAGFVDATEEAGLSGPLAFATDAAWADVDGDADLDLFVARYTDASPGSNTLYRNQGDGTFTAVTAEVGLLEAPIPTILGDQTPPASLESRFVDADNDGDPDLLVANDRAYIGLHPGFFYRNDGTGHFTDVAAELGFVVAVNAMGFGISDFDRDGWLDVFVTNTTEGHLHFQHHCDGYEDVALEVGTLTNKSGWAVVTEDFNQDGWVDMYIAHDLGLVEGFDHNALYVNQQDGTFLDVAGLSDAGGGAGERTMTAATGDLDGDGDLDLIVSSHIDGGVRVLRNDTPGIGNWLHVRLTGVASNRDGLGARVEVHHAGHVMLRELASTSSWLSTHQRRLFFGLGDAEVVDRVVVRWPSGAVQTLVDVAANQIIEVLEEDDASVPAAGVELCGDGLDNDCDGVADALGAEASCVVPLGGCQVAGALTCGAFGSAPVCEAQEVAPEGPELCGDGVDNDCDGDVDEGYPDIGMPCAAGVGACEVVSAWVCAEDGLGVDCPAAALEPGAELCGDGADNDCDGATDEGFDELGAGCALGLGACRAEALWVCDVATGAPSCPASPGEPGDELCGGGVDDDCDGATDEGFEALGTGCEVGVGACAVLGVLACNEAADGLQCAPLAPPAAPTKELCGDGVDNDCDGLTDEGFEALGAPCAAGIGGCLASGVLACAADADELECAAVPLEPAAERCGDLVDDDCDGLTDEGFALDLPCVVGQGACAVSGVTICDAEGFGTACAAVPLPAAMERCGDGIDNDCDGATDEDYPVGESCQVGIGGCMAMGIVLCAPHGYAAICGALPGEPSAEWCGDGVDNDCDGAVDEDCAAAAEPGSSAAAQPEEDAGTAAGGDVEQVDAGPEAPAPPAVAANGCRGGRGPGSSAPWWFALSLAVVGWSGPGRRPAAGPHQREAGQER